MQITDPTHQEWILARCEDEAKYGEPTRRIHELTKQSQRGLLTNEDFVSLVMEISVQAVASNLPPR